MKHFYLSYKNPIAALLIFILVGGIYSLQNLQTGLFPDITFPKIKIIAENGQQPINKMMLTVTVPLENEIKKVQNLKLIRSITGRGSCEISAFLDWSSDVDLGKQRIEARINSIKQELPPGINIVVEKMNPSILPVIDYSLEGEHKSQIELKQIAEYTIKPFLSQVEGVAEIVIIGGKTKEFRVVLDALKMSALGITPKETADILSNSNFISSNGYIEDNNRLYLSITDAAIDRKDELENTIVKNTINRTIRVKDIAQVKITERKEYIKINANGKDVPLVAIVKQPEANLMKLSGDIKKKIKELNHLLPKGISLKQFYNQADFVSDSISSLRDVLWIGLLLSLILTVLFLRSFKASSVLLVSIPITLSLTVASLYAFGFTLNIMTIGAIAAAIGLIIDDAIVVIEQIHRTHEEHPDENSYHLVTKAIRYLFPAMVGSSLSTIVIFFPFVLMSGVAGAYFKVMTNTMIITLVCSFIVTWIGLPVIYIMFSKEQHSIKVSAKELKKRNWVGFFVHRPIIAIAFLILLTISAVFILPTLPSGFLPDMDEGSLVLDFNSPPGTSLEETDYMLQKVDKILNEIPEVESFSRRIGTQMGFFITEQNRGDFLIQLKIHRTKSTMDVADDIRRKVESAVPALTIEFGQVIGDMLGDLMTSAQPIEIKIFGDDETALQKLADKITVIVEKVNGTADVFNGITIAGPELIIEPKIAKLAQYGLSPLDFQFQMQDKTDGNIVGRIIERNRLTDLRMLENNDKAISLNSIRKSRIFLPNGIMKPVDEFADFKLVRGVAEIERENLKPMIAVTARLNNRDLGSTITEIKNKIGSELALPNGYHITYGGAYSEQQSAFSELMTILIIAGFLVFVVILFLFKKIKAALLIMILSFTGIAGSLLALLITNTPLNVGSYTGMIMIVGIIGENSIFTYLQFTKSRKLNPLDDAIIYSISTRLRPKLMTAFGAITALFPLALGIGTGAQMHQPLAIAIIGGLIIALPLLLIVLPSLLRIIEPKEIPPYLDADKTL